MTIIKKDGSKNRLIVDQLGYGTGDSPNEGSASVVLSSDADYTLLNTEYNAQVIFITSSVSLTTTRNIILPLSGGSDWIIKNSTTGGQALVIKGATGSGVTVEDGYSVHIFCDGTDMYSASGPAGPPGPAGADGPTGPTGPAGPSGGTTARQSVASYGDTYVNSWSTVGSFQIIWTSPATYTSWVFAAILAAPSGYSLQARLFDVTNNATVTGSTISTSNTTPIYIDSGGSMSVPAVNETRLYLVQISIVSGSPSNVDRGIILSAFSDLS